MTLLVPSVFVMERLAAGTTSTLPVKPLSCGVASPNVLVWVLVMDTASASVSMADGAFTVSV